MNTYFFLDIDIILSSSVHTAMHCIVYVCLGKFDYTRLEQNLARPYVCMQSHEAQCFFNSYTPRSHVKLDYILKYNSNS